MNTTVCSPAAAPRLGAAGVVLAAHGLAAAGLLALSPPAQQAETPKILQVAWIAEPAAPAPAAPARTATPLAPRHPARTDAAPAPRPAAQPQAASLQSGRPAATPPSSTASPTPAPSAAPPADSPPDNRTHESPAPREAATPTPRNAAPVADSPPRFDADYLSNPAPDYPAASRQLREQGSVQLRVFVTTDGRAGDVRVHQGSGFERLDQAAIDAVRRWRFVPARQGDGPVAAWVIVPINFTLRRS
jgi:protein TonB